MPIYILINKKNLKKNSSNVMVVISLSVKFIENTPTPDLEPSYLRSKSDILGTQRFNHPPPSWKDEHF